MVYTIMRGELGPIRTFRRILVVVKEIIYKISKPFILLKCFLLSVRIGNLYTRHVAAIKISLNSIILLLVLNS